MRGLVLSALLIACSGQHGEDICANTVPAPAACMLTCDATPNAANTCPAGYHCTPDGKCDAFCTQTGNECGDGYMCTSDGTCLNNGACMGQQCNIVACEAQGKPPTTISGVVYAPNGTLPLYGVNAYVPNKDPGAFTPGRGCVKCTDPLPGDPVAQDTSIEDGSFHIKDAPSGTKIPVIIASGKWRRQLVIQTVNPCTDNPLSMADTTLPKAIDDLSPSSTSVDMPQIAVTTGSADSLECLIRKLGIADKEITTSAGTGHVHLYQGNGVGKFTASFPGGAGQSFSSATPFWNETGPHQLEAYDIVILSCEGAQDAGENGDPDTKPQTAMDAMKNYADLGGRIFASHWHNVWIGGAWNGGPANRKPAIWSSIATWNNNADPGTTDLIDELNNPKGGSFATWMVNVGGSTTRDQIILQGGTDRSTVATLDGTKAERWTYTAAAGMKPQNFQFTTPNENAQEARCGKVVFSDMHVSGGPGNGDYPDSCGTSLTLTAQEKALAFMFFDLASCVGTIF